MSELRYQRPTSLADARAALDAPGAVPMGGGTDLLSAIDDGIIDAGTLVDLRRLPGADEIALRPDGSVRIGAAARIQDLASDAFLAANYPALAEACAAVGTPALREMGTLGGNLCQRPRCWYLRRGISCFKSGGNDCPARDGENQFLAILEGGPCYIVHPSDPAVALTALEALIEIDGSRTVPIAEFYVRPDQRLDQESILTPGQFVSAVILPAASAGGRQRYTKLMQRGAWDFALVSAAAVKRLDGEVRIALGGVAPRPWRVPNSIEEDISAGNLDEDALAVLAERALYDAQPLSKNGYKLQMAQTLIRRSAAFLLAL